MLGICCCYYSGPSIGCQLSFSSSSGCVGVADVGAGNQAAHFSPEGWKVPPGNTGRRVAGLALAEGMGRACKDAGTFIPTHSTLTAAGEGHQPKPRPVPRQRKRHTMGHRLIFSSPGRAVVRDPQREGTGSQP